MALTVLASGSQELDWPTSWEEALSFQQRWGLTWGTAIRALALGWYAQHSAGLRIYIISGYRSAADQAQLYAEAQRGERPYPVAAPGTSLHELGRAFDVGSDRELNAGQWQDLHELGSRIGLSGVSADPPHFEYRGG